jgi:predicted GH43/DUF377 family glycosyl hydrolase
MSTTPVQRSSLMLHPDRTRVLLRPFLLPNEPRARTICRQVLALPESEVLTRWAQVQAEFGDRHAPTREFLQRRFEQARPCLPTDRPLSTERELLLGAYFSHEYSLEAAALFPRKIQGRYAMLSRQDKENIYLMFSDHLHFWHTAHRLLQPKYPWEFIQLGNCGSPIETEAGWLVLSHGVGAMRKYCIGAFLLDRDDPSRVLGRLREPLISPNENEREGYVPNVVYSCGSLVHGRQLIIPYAMSDYATTFATLSLETVLSAME